MLTAVAEEFPVSIHNCDDGDGKQSSFVFCNILYAVTVDSQVSFSPKHAAVSSVCGCYN
jgi:hypothetical protein